MGSLTASPVDLRTHLLRPWTLYVEVFESKAVADRWAADSSHYHDVDASVSSWAPPLPPSPHTFEEGSLVRVVSSGGDFMYDLADATSASYFFVAVAACPHVKGVRVQGVALTPETELDHIPAAAKRRRLEAGARGAPRCAGASASASMHTMADNYWSAGGDDTRLLVIGQAGRGGKQSPPRPLMSWSYYGATATAEERGKAATAPPCSGCLFPPAASSRRSESSGTH